MNPANWPGHLAYVAVFIATAVESEVIFVTACALVSAGHLNALGVLVAGALGGSAGDQFWYYALRGRLHRWLARFPSIADRHEAIVARVRRHSTIMVLAVRFLPGLRVALSAACAYAGVPRLKFTTLDLASAFCFAGLLMAIVAYGGPELAQRIGLHGKWAVAIPPALLLLFLWWLGRATKKLDESDSGTP